MSDVHQNSLLLSVLSQFITSEFKSNKRFGFKLNSMHHKLAVLAQPYPVNLTYEHEFVVGVEGPLTPFRNLVIEMAETVLEGNHKISPDLRTIVTAGLASHLTLISRCLKRLLLGVKSASFLNNTK